jgi:hypothetical protein
MNQFAYISQVMSNVHESVEGWARDLLRTAGLETTEVYGQFPPEGSVASHVVLFPYRMGGADSQIATPYNELSLMGVRAHKGSVPGMPPVWGRLGELFTECIMEKYPKMTKGPHAGKPHPAPPISRLPQPLADWYNVQKDTGTGASWVTELGGEQFARLPSLTWVPGASIKVNYLAVVGEGARGTADRDAPVAVQAMSVLTAGMQLQRSIEVRIPPPAFDRSIVGYAEAVGQTLGDDRVAEALVQVEDMDEDLYMPITLLPGNSLSNSDFTGLMQALQRPLQPTLHMAVSLSVGGTPSFTPGVNADVRSEQKSRRPQGR